MSVTQFVKFYAQFYNLLGSYSLLKRAKTSRKSSICA